MNDECFYFGKSNFNLGCILGFACALITVIVPTVLCEPDDKHPNKQQAVGHLMPLGQQRLPEGSVHKVIGFPDAKRFFDDYVQQNEPVVFKGAANHIPAFKLWTDTYLNEKYGHIRVSAEQGKKENRSEKSFLLPLSEFLQVYRTEDVYMVQDLTEAFHADYSLPPCLSCGGFERGLEVGTIWFSSGDTQSVLHMDDVDNINCLLDGQKELVLIDREYDYLVEAEHWHQEGTYSDVDVAAVDLNKFPSLGQAPWWKAVVEAGDCIFIPYRWYHSVYSTPGRNLAVNLFFAHRLWLDEKDCDSKPEHPQDQYESLAKYRINSLHPEHVAVDKMRADIFEVFEGEPEIDLEYATDVWEDIMDPAEIQALFEAFDTNKDMILSWKEIYDADILELLGDFPFLLPENVDEQYEKPRDWQDGDEMDADHYQSSHHEHGEL
ncbi:hypothetical protein LSH36_148g02021 [Paralvinella palmiformis]|uniref:JmjC domain-containing protein n=1 Tax=Paralvinella palmiformis TaxID=53620 RepID=A0AAD9JWC9_9ANNE|nr:hypothetical protein LSH36_148g02021 [Paralvinella palmiformis]